MNSLNEYTKNLRRDFLKASFDEKDAHNDPFIQFENWYAQTIEGKLVESNAMTVATATKEGKPSARIVFLRGYENHGFTFFTNYQSRKGEELLENPYASLLFYWPELERQIRMEGIIEKASKEVSDAYFAARPQNSRIGAWASPQSSVLKDRHELENLVSEYTTKFKEEIPRPDNWGGYVLKASYYEFWQGRASRLHDRICYTQQVNGEWKKERLAP